MTKSGQLWTASEELQLIAEFNEGYSPVDLAAMHDRTVTAVLVRLQMLNVIYFNTRNFTYYRIGPVLWTQADIVRMKKGTTP